MWSEPKDDIVVCKNASEADSSHLVCSTPKNDTAVCKKASEAACNSESLVNLWHSRLGHPNKVVLHQVLSQINVSVPLNASLKFCEACKYGQLHQNDFPSSAFLHTTGPFQVVHTDVWGPAPLLSIEGYRFYIGFVDDFTGYTWVYPLRLKSEAAAICMKFLKMVERQFDIKVKCLQSDSGGEFRKLQRLLHDLGIHFLHSCPHTHQQN